MFEIMRFRVEWGRECQAENMQGTLLNVSILMEGEAVRDIPIVVED